MKNYLTIGMLCGTMIIMGCATNKDLEAVRAECLSTSNQAVETSLKAYKLCDQNRQAMDRMYNQLVKK